MKRVGKGNCRALTALKKVLRVSFYQDTGFPGRVILPVDFPSVAPGSVDGLSLSVFWAEVNGLKGLGFCACANGLVESGFSIDGVVDENGFEAGGAWEDDVCWVLCNPPDGLKPEVNVELKLGVAFEVNEDEKDVGGCEKGLFVCDWVNGLVPVPKFIEGVD